MNEEFEESTQASMDLRKIEKLHHVTRELSGVVMEWVALPCESLRSRMINTVHRYQQAIRECAPDVSLEEWNARELQEFNKWVKFREQTNPMPEEPK